LAQPQSAQGENIDAGAKFGADAASAARRKFANAADR
jgi:hypothetical protein